MSAPLGRFLSVTTSRPRHAHHVTDEYGQRVRGSLTPTELADIVAWNMGLELQFITDEVKADLVREAEASMRASHVRY